MLKFKKKHDVTKAYLRHQEINDYLDSLRIRYNDIVKIDWHKRSRKTDSGEEPVPKDIVFIEAGTHAREWMTIAVALKCIQQLTEKHTRHLAILDKLRFFIVPVANPDGYEYTYETNRMWRKNRRPHNAKCIGTDCNRNYDFHWEDGSAKPNRSTYKGEKPFSEPETRALRNVMEKLRPNMLLFLSLHSYGQAIMYPWGYTRELPSTWREHQQLAECGKDAISKVSGRQYRCGSISSIRKKTYPGSIVDYAYAIVQVPFALVVELPSNELGFQPSPAHIQPIGNESWVGIKAMCKKALEIR